MAKVKVAQGWLEGEILESVTGDQKYYSFKGIPYAQPPVGNLRFKAPRPPLPWDGVRKATEHGSVCPQLDIFTQQILAGNEDCLFLNVYSPNLKPNSPLPVMFFIHGGGYKSGSGDVSHYGPDFLVRHGVVLVTINYRLEALGFLCLDTEDVPGNAGLKDQVAALRWVKENISNFGGDPENVTIFGESAGGASVGFHVLSPMTKGLFKRAICMSGVPYCDWSTSYKPRQRAFLLGKLLGKDTDDANELLEFLQSVPVEKLVDTNPTILASEEVTNNIMKMYHFAPTAEKKFGKDHFLTEKPGDAIRNGRVNKVDVLIGHTDEEMLVGVPFLDSMIPAYSRYSEMLVPKRILTECNADVILELAERIHRYYFTNMPIDIKSAREFLKYGNESTFIYYIHKFISDIPGGALNSRYFYKFTCLSDRNAYGKKGEQFGIKGASHLDDLMYLFDAKILNMKIDRSSKEFKMVELVCTVFTNFAKYGNPTPDSSLGVTWPEYDSRSKRYVVISDKLVEAHAVDDETLKFWQGVIDSAGINV